MRFYSTNNPPLHKATEGRKIKLVDFETALMRGLAEDGGLYLPQQIKQVEKLQVQSLKFNEIAFEVARHFVDIPAAALKKIIKEAFTFPAPLVKLDNNLYILELFHGPTLSFKDFGARFMARVMNYYLKKSGEKLNIIVATSGDTGSAVASGFYGLSNIKVFVLYPTKRISKLQEKQITTWGKNIVALEVKGDFDDCQRLAKQALSDPELRTSINLSSANSINIGRLIPQTFYYFWALTQYKDVRRPYIEPVFVVPSGNFGNLTAGLFAKKMSLPVNKFIAAVNKNSAIPEFLKTGKMKEKKTVMTFSNAMDVGKPSNWDRVMDLYGGNLNKINQDIEAMTISEGKTRETIRETYKKYNYIADPHTAVGLAAAFARRSLGEGGSPVIVLSTAHPAKFQDVVETAIGKKIPLPKNLAAVSKKPKKSILIANTLDQRAWRDLLIPSR